jgi:heme O synthase-like polyprenyltransferase
MKQLFSHFAEIINESDIGYTGLTDSSNLMSGILNTVYFWAGIVAVGFIVYGGYLYVLSSGDPGKVRKAKDTLLYSVIGLVVVLVAFVVTRFVINGV